MSAQQIPLFEGNDARIVCQCSVCECDIVTECRGDVIHSEYQGAGGECFTCFQRKRKGESVSPNSPLPVIE